MPHRKGIESLALKYCAKTAEARRKLKSCGIT